MEVTILGRVPEITEAQSFPLYMSPVKAGFPSPADDFLEGMIDLNKHLIKHPASTYLIRVSGNSMINAGIGHDDILIVDTSIKPKHKDIVIACLDGEMTVKRLYQTAKKTALLPENDFYEAIVVREGMDFSVWGVVKNIIKDV